MLLFYLPPMHIHLHGADYVVVGVYFCLVIGIGWMAKRHLRKDSDFLLSNRSLPPWITGLAFLSVNLSAQEIMAAAASGAKYGIMACHFYWIGAIPAMVFLAIFMMPFYYGSKARSVPEFLKLRFDEKTHALNSMTFAVSAVVLSGISLHAVAELLTTLVGWNYGLCIAMSAFVVFIYIFLGGLTSAIYNETLQFFMMVIGFTPLSIFALKDIGGWTALKQKLKVVATNEHFAPGTWTEAWRHTGHTADNPMGVGWFGMVAGLGFVLSFGYWCTNFSVVQRAMAASSMSAARQTPLIAAVPKMIFPALTILPGMVAIALQASSGGRFLPIGPDGAPDYNLTIPIMLQHYFPTGLLGLGFTALMASFMSGMAGNITAFNTVWSYDIYQNYLAPNKSDRHYLWIGRVATMCAILMSIGVAYVASTKFNNIMDMLQLVASFVNAPLLATFLLGMFWRRTTGHGAFFGLLGGTLSAAAFHGCSLANGNQAGINGGWLGGYLIFSSEMGQTFWIGIVAWSVCFALTLVISLVTRQIKTDAELTGLVFSLTRLPKTEHWRLVTLGIFVLLAVIILNILFW